MNIKHFEGKEDWLLNRYGKITGTRASELVKKGGGKKMGFYELIAERLTVSEEDFDGYIPNETPMDRGTRLQSYAIDRYEKETKNKVDQSLILWERKDNPNIAVSPDGVVSQNLAVECKCLSSARHVEAHLKHDIPDDYYEQVRQYFVVNDDLQKLDMIFYDTRLPAIQYFVLEIPRARFGEEEIQETLELQKEILQEVDGHVMRLSNF